MLSCEICDRFLQLPTEFPLHELGQLFILRELRRVGHHEVRIKPITNLAAEPEDEPGGDAVDDLGRRHAEHLGIEDMLKSLLVIRVDLLHLLAAVEPLHDLGDVHRHDQATGARAGHEGLITARKDFTP